MGYPVSYRTSLARSSRPSFQGGGGGLEGRFGIPRNLPKSANDNELVPANDLSGLAENEFADLVLAKVAPRYLPFLNYARTAWELYQLINNTTPAGSMFQWTVSADWTLTAGCALNVGSPFQGTRLGAGVCGEQHGFNGNPFPPLNNSTNMFFMYYELRPAFSKYLGTYYSNYTRAAGKTEPGVSSPAYPASGMFRRLAPQGFALPVGLPWPSLAPAAQPIPFGQPVTVPRPIPWRVLPGIKMDPLTPSKEQLVQGYGVARDLNSLFEGNPAGALDIAKGVAVKPEHRYTPPPRDVREKKFSTGAATAATFVRALYDASTEAVDLLDSFYWATSGRRPKPKWYRGPNGKWWKAPPNPVEKAIFIGKNIQNLDLNKAWRNVANNEIKDRFYGTIGKKLGQGAQAIHNSGYGSFSRAPQVSRQGVPFGSALPDFF